MPSRTATAVGDSVTGTSKVYKRNQQDWTNILLLTSKLVILVLQDQPNKIVFLRNAFNISVELCMNYTFYVNAYNHQFYVCKESQYKDSWNALKSFWFQEQK